MSTQQLAELEAEMSQLVSDDERMLLNHEIRFWRQKAWRADQQRERLELEKKNVEALAEKYKDIPEDRLNRLLSEIKEEELKAARAEAEKYSGTIGLTNFRKLVLTSEDIKKIDDRIAFWKKVATNYLQYGPVEEEEEEEDDVE